MKTLTRSAIELVSRPYRAGRRRAPRSAPGQGQRISSTARTLSFAQRGKPGSGHIREHIGCTFCVLEDEFSHYVLGDADGVHEGDAFVVDQVG
ncbi:hypothetical protein H9Y04_40980 [Streptomyces sp. TRM66268-LWL]|uniref:Uncharacterized protein n=1 Tax=Streptomyces polyasparticus TaxID=2767826 RepID=A0ABR7STX3_9ACTN|nr:hypothetical protein [Streptomyces polyasparticus]MBC9718920.1 hypothetical protein [Streptomyces polyasparticus]